MSDPASPLVALFAPLVEPDVLLRIAAIGALVGALLLVQRRLAGSLLSLGPRLLVWPLIMPGTVLHELAHALTALLLGCRIVEFRPFWPERTEDGGWTFGRVSWAGGDPIRATLIGLAPLLLVPPLLSGVLLLVLGPDPLAALLAGPPERSAAALAFLALGGRAAAPSAGDPVNPIVAALLLVLAALGLGALGGQLGAGALLGLLDLVIAVLVAPALVGLALVALLRA